MRRFARSLRDWHPTPQLSKYGKAREIVKQNYRTPSSIYFLTSAAPKRHVQQSTKQIHISDLNNEINKCADT